jgi:Glycosyl hydrolases family 18
MAGTERFVAYWTGYTPGNVTLADTPDSIDYVNLFLLNLDPTKALNYNYITSTGNSWDQILQWTRTLQSRGQKVLASVISSKTYDWNQIPDPASFAEAAVNLVVNQLGLDGIDIDPEMPDPPNQTFIDVVAGLRSALGADKLLTYVSYQLGDDSPLLKQNISLLDYVSLMGYFWNTQEQIYQFQQYSQIVPPANLLFGISPGGVVSTPLAEVKELTRWEPDGGQKGGMMLFATPYDNPQYTHRPDWTYCQTIEKGLGATHRPLS